MDFAEFIRETREKHNMPIRKLAAEMDMDTSTLSKIERKDRQVTPAMIPVLARVFKLDYKELQIKFLSQRIKNEYGELDYFTEAIEDLFNQLK